MKPCGNTLEISQPPLEAGAVAVIASFFLAITLIFHLLPNARYGTLHGLYAPACVILFLACIAILLFFHSRLLQALPSHSSAFVISDASGIFLARKRELPAQFKAWESIAEVVLTRKFRIIYSEGRLICRHVVIIFLRGNPDDSGNSQHQSQAGISISAMGRLYLSADFPSGNWHGFESALRRYATDGVAVRICSKIDFDHKTGTDNYVEV